MKKNNLIDEKRQKFKTQIINLTSKFNNHKSQDLQEVIIDQFIDSIFADSSYQKYEKNFTF